MKLCSTTVQVLSVVAVLAVAGCDKGEDEKKEKETTEEKAAKDDEPEPSREGPLKPLPKKVDDVDMAKVEIGRRLYFDPFLSGDDSISCASCHSFEHGGADGMRTSTGVDGQKGPIASPTVLNSRYNFKQFWDGRAGDLAHQAEGPVANDIEMGNTWEEAVKKLEGDEWYTEKFGEVYDGELTMKNVTHAIAEYEETLVTPAPFDEYLRGDDEAISEAAKMGYEEFKSVGCTTCHTGLAVGGTMFQKMGLVNSYFDELDRPLLEPDLGRYNVTENEADKYKFKVPTLRNIELTAPYFHDGSVKELDEAVRQMAHLQLGKELSDEQVSNLVAFLESLTGELPETASAPEGFERAVSTPPQKAAEEDPYTLAEQGDPPTDLLVGGEGEGEGKEGAEAEGGEGAPTVEAKDNGPGAAAE
ncbi:MAG: cytochrome-c peroxidase [Polyangiales bacterium]